MDKSWKVWNKYHKDDMIFEEKTGTRGKYKFVIHHINGDHMDNRIENLQKMTHSEHVRLHTKGKSHSEDHRKRQSETMKKFWKDPERRKRQSEIQRKLKNEFWKDPEKRKRHSEIMKRATKNHKVKGMTGKHFSKESKKKMSEKRKEYLENKNNTTFKKNKKIKYNYKEYVEEFLTD
jgi:hypothetical protein